MDARSGLAALEVGGRISLRLVDPATDLIGFVTALEPLTVEDRHGELHRIPAERVVALRRVGVALGRDPNRAPRALLDDLANRAGLALAEPELHRISDVLAGLTPPTAVFAERGSWARAGWRAKVDGEWLSTNVTEPALLVELAWWATRQNARSIQVRPAGGAFSPQLAGIGDGS